MLFGQGGRGWATFINIKNSEKAEHPKICPSFGGNLGEPPKIRHRHIIPPPTLGRYNLKLFCKSKKKVPPPKKKLVSVLLSASVERFSVSRKRDFCNAKSSCRNISYSKVF